jgi:outer membrane protein TolC
MKFLVCHSFVFKKLDWRVKHLLTSVVLGLAACHANADDGVAGSALSLPQLTQRLLQDNPQLRSAVGGAVAAQLGVSPARALDNPTFSVNQNGMQHNPLAVGTSTQTSWTYSQNILWPGKKSLAGDIVQAQANVSKEQVEYLKVQLLGQLQSTWVSWQQTNAQIRLSKAQADRLEQIKDIVKLRYANNTAAYVDFINAQVTQAQIKSDIIGLERQQQTNLAQIASLIGYSSAGPALKLASEPVQANRDLAALETFKQRALEVNPQIHASKEAVNAAQKAVELAELGKRPDFSVSVTTNSATPPAGFADSANFGLSVGATIPLYYAQKERYLIDQAKAQLGAARDADESTVQQVDLAVESAYLQWAQSIEQLKLVEDRIVTQAHVGYRLALTNYSTNQMSYTDLLNAYNALRAAEISAEQARAMALQSRIALDVAVGEIQK